jgi:hypothetical protein
MNRDDRDRAVDLMRPGMINVRITAELRDVDDPGIVRRGVHWRRRNDPQHRRYILLSTISHPWVLAHELGHYLGEAHSFVDDNLMSYGRTGGQLFLDAQQVGRIRRAVKRLVHAVRESISL